jgi:hypothetical protein
MRTMKKKIDDKPVEIMFVESDPKDLLQFIEVFNESMIPHNIRFCGNGEESLIMIRQLGEYSNIPKPDIIIFDLKNLRNKGGWEILAEIIQAECIPLVILSDIEGEEELWTYRKCPNLLITKPNKLEEYKDALKAVEEFWLNIQSNTKK